MTDIVSRIWGAAETAGLLSDLTTAESRARLDNFLRAQLADLHDKSVRDHAAELLRVKRAQAFGVPDEVWRCIRDLQERVAILEARRPDEIRHVRDLTGEDIAYEIAITPIDAADLVMINRYGETP